MTVFVLGVVEGPGEQLLDTHRGLIALGELGEGLPGINSFRNGIYWTTYFDSLRLTSKLNRSLKNIPDPLLCGGRRTSVEDN